MFLFKLDELLSGVHPKANLHYSMFLFKLKLQAGLLLLKIIYITVCFYLNPEKLLNEDSDFKIYITVCFYLNHRSVNIVGNGILFTLQYVSI